jgi:hypothetical protein
VFSRLVVRLSLVEAIPTLPQLVIHFRPNIACMTLVIAVDTAEPPDIEFDIHT